MVVVSGSWVKNVVSYPSNGDLIATTKMAAKAVLICRPNSHPFQERTLSLDQPVKIGRSVARARAVPNNAIFDCKVLSRNHALLWYENGKFYLQDTKSSNGTFVNNQRLSKGAEESPPREVCSGDIVQFGVDVMENSRKVTHGCIVATLKLYLPDGKEAKASPSTSVVSSVGMVPLEDLYQLNQYLQEALQREQLLENKLANLQHLVEATRQASELGWKALIDEDRLLSRVETLENQLQVSSKNFAEDKLREELRKLQEDKSQYQGTAKESLRKVLQEKLDAIQKLQALELSLSNTESECAHLKKLCERSQQDLQDLAQKYSLQLQKVEDLTSKLQDTDEQNRETCERLEQEKRELQNRLQEQIDAERALQLRLEALEADGDLSQQKLAALQSHLGLMKSNEENDGDTKLALDNMKGTPETTGDDVILERIDPVAASAKELESMRYQLKKCEEELQASHERVNQLHQQVELIELEKKDHLDEVANIQVQLEDVRNEEDSSEETTLQLQERIDDVEVELDHVQSEVENNKNAAMQVTAPNNAAPSPNQQANKLKAEKTKLQELLSEARAKKRAFEVQKGQYQLELDCANVKVKKTMEEANVLKQQLQAAQCQMNSKNETVQELQKELKSYERSVTEAKMQLGLLQEILREEQQRRSRHAIEAEQFRKQLMEAQQNAKQSHNEAEQMKDRLKAIQAELDLLRRTTVDNQDEGDNKSQEELTHLRQRCSSLETENDRLRSEYEEAVEQNQDLHEARVKLAALVQQQAQITSDSSDVLAVTSQLLSTVDAENEPNAQTLALEEELVVVKQSFTRCNDEKTMLSCELEKLRLEFTALASQSYAVPVHYFIPIAMAVVVISVALNCIF